MLLSKNLFKKIILGFMILSAILLLTGTAFAATPISTLEDLKKIGTGGAGWELSDEYYLTQNIVIKETWTGIGTNSKPFTGSLTGIDPNNVNPVQTVPYTITLESTTDNPFIFHSTDTKYNKNFGLFCSVNGAKFDNLTIIVKSDVFASTDGGFTNASTGNHVGILAGRAVGNGQVSIKNCSIIPYADATKTPVLSGNYNVAGFLGSAHPAKDTEAVSVIIEDSHITIDIKGIKLKDDDVTGGVRIGGFIGNGSTLCSKITITKSDFKGNISGSKNVGGFIGILQKEAEITSSKFNGNVSGSDHVGGVVGFLYEKATFNDVDVTDSNIDGANFVGGFIGAGNTPDDNVFPLSITASEFKGNVSCTGNYVGGIIGAVRDDTTFTDVSVNGNVTAGTSGSGGIAGYIHKGPVTFNTINVRGKITAKEGNYSGGLIGFVNATYSPKITIQDSFSSADISAGKSYAGGLAGNLLNGRVTSSYATGNVIAGGSASGGLAGRSTSSTISQSNATGNVSAGVNYAGGLVGDIIGGEVTSSYATGNVKAGTSYSGGLAGKVKKATISQSYSTGNVLGSYWIGGFAGDVIDATIKESYATGNVTGGDGGGFIGRLISGKISDSYSTGNVLVTSSTAISTQLNAGGFIGRIYDGSDNIEVKNCYSTGTAVSQKFTDDSAVGGFVGLIGSSQSSYVAEAKVSVIDCISFGNNIQGNPKAGIFVGQVDFSGIPIREEQNPAVGLPYTMDVEIKDSHYWDKTYVKGSYVEPVNIDTVDIKTSTLIGYAPTTKNDVWFTLAENAIWDNWDSDDVWAQAPVESGYGLPILKWQSAEGAPIPNGDNVLVVYTPPSSGSSTGGGKIIETSQSGTTESSGTVDNTQNNGSTSSTTNTDSATGFAGDQQEDSSINPVWIVAVGGIICIAAIGAFAYSKYRK